jgi:hypothetical protein
MIDAETPRRANRAPPPSPIVRKSSVGIAQTALLPDVVPLRPARTLTPARGGGLGAGSGRQHGRRLQRPELSGP